MTTQADFDAFVESQRGVRRLVLRDLEAWWLTVKDYSPSRIESEAAAFLPLLAVTYGEVSATVAADFYELSRDSSIARGAFVASLPESSAGERVGGNLRYMVAPMLGPDPLDPLGRAGVKIDAAALHEGRATVAHNVERDPAKPRFARVPVGKTCAWCVMLASRGAVYRSAASAGDAGQYHGGDCDCQPVASWDNGDDLPPSYDEGRLVELYDRAKSEADSGAPRDVAAAMRRLDGGSLVNDGVAPSL